MNEKCRVVICTARQHGAVLRVINAIKEVEVDGKISLIGILYDSGKKKKRTWKKIKRWYEIGGLSYVLYRAVLSLSRKPRYSEQHSVNIFSLASSLQIPLKQVPSINSNEALAALEGWQPDIAVSSGNRIIRKSILAIPRHGMINLHHGKLPDFKGGPPGFWELYHNKPTMGITVHVMDEKLDNGAILAQREFTIDYDRDSPETLYKKAASIDGNLVVEALLSFISGEMPSRKMSGVAGKVFTLPTRKERRTLEKRLGRRIDPLGYLNV